MGNCRFAQDETPDFTDEQQVAPDRDERIGTNEHERTITSRSSG
jgi:hypothetical protein